MLPGVDFSAVHVLTTMRPKVDLIKEFFADRHPEVQLTISRVEGFDDFNSEEDHFRFEETLYRWILQAEVPISKRWFCLSGGFKTMSASMQKAASLFGTAGVFHVLAPSDIPMGDSKFRAASSIPEILEAHALQKLHWIQLGAQVGWPQLRRLRAADYPLARQAHEDSDGLTPPDDALRCHIAGVESKVHAISHSWDVLTDLPFNELATWSEQDLLWLNDPIDPASDRDKSWIASLSKLELHCHLGGFATQGVLLKDVESAAKYPDRLRPRLAPKMPLDWPLPKEPCGLEPYRKLGDNNGSRLLRDPGCLKKQCELLYDYFLSENIVYAEIRCSPANYADPFLDRSPWDVLCDIREAFQNRMNQGFGSKDGMSSGSFCHVNLIIIGTRQATGDYRAGISRHLALAVTAAEHWNDSSTCRVVGVDLAGFEDPTTRAHYFREEFTAVHRCGLALTAHAGENDDAEGIWRAVFELNARRLGHALSLSQSPDLMKSVADRGIGIEMCPYANLQIKGFDLDQINPAPSAGRSYPLLDYLQRGLKVTVNTDNIGISSAGLSDNLLLAARLCPGLKRMDLLRLQRNALDTCFEDTLRKQDLLKWMNQSISRLPL